MITEERQLLAEKYGGKETADFPADCRRLQEGEPLAYVIGYQPFLGLKIWLDSHPLIPRPETEWWTGELLSALSSESVFSTKRVNLGLAAPSALFGGKTDEHFRKGFDLLKKRVSQHDGARGGDFSAEKDAAPFFAASDLRILDLCAGSGAIGCAALAALPDAHISFGEIEKTHEKTIYKNITENNLDLSRAEVRIGDLFEPFSGHTFDVIAANPPYIPLDRTLPESVTRYEPSEALFSGTDGLTLIRRLAHEAPAYLSEKGMLFVECDSGHASETRALFVQTGFTSVIHTDLYGRARLVVSYRQ